MSRKQQPDTASVPRKERAVKQPPKLRAIKPITRNQHKAFVGFRKGENLILKGYPGTGKSFISCYLAAEEFSKEENPRNLVIIRSAVSTRDIGFLPGSMDGEKAAAYERPYEQIFGKLYSFDRMYENHKIGGRVSFELTSFLRSMTFDNSVIFVDEMQNMTFQELDTIITRVGDNSQIIFSGDFFQTDLSKASDKSGLNEFLGILDTMGGFTHVDFEANDIVRGELVKKYILAKVARERSLQLGQDRRPRTDRNNHGTGADLPHTLWQSAIDYHGSRQPA
jgi:phosphate starvation-inducible protein PhoH